MNQELVDRLTSGMWAGALEIRTHENRFLCAEWSHGTEGNRPRSVDYSDDPHSWRISPSPRGAPWVKIGIDAYILQEFKGTYNWKCDLDDRQLVVLHGGDPQDWESWRFESHPSATNPYGLAIVNYASRLYTAAEPSNHRLRLQASRQVKDLWERFEVRSVP